MYFRVWLDRRNLSLLNVVVCVTIHYPGVIIFNLENDKIGFVNTWVTEMSGPWYTEWRSWMRAQYLHRRTVLLMTIKQPEITRHSLHRPSVEVHTHHTAIAVSQHTAGWPEGVRHGRTVAEDSTPQPAPLLLFVSQIIVETNSITDGAHKAMRLSWWSSNWLSIKTMCIPVLNANTNEMSVKDYRL